MKRARYIKSFTFALLTWASQSFFLSPPVLSGVASKEPAADCRYPDEKARLFDYVSLARFKEVHKICNSRIADGTAQPYHFLAESLSCLYMQLGVQRRAVQVCLSGLQYYPNDLALEANLALAYARTSQWSQAFRQANAVLESAPENPLALAVKALCLRNSGQEQKGLELLRKALSLDAGNRDLNMLLAFFAKKSGQISDAYAAYDRIIKANPRSALAYTNRAEIEHDEMREDEAIRDFERALALNPSYAQAAYKLGKLYYNRQRWADSGRVLLLWEKAGGKQEAGIVKLCDCMLRTKQYKEAARVATIAMEVFKYENFRREDKLGVPGFTVLHESSMALEAETKRAIAYFYMGETQKALDDVASVLKAHPDYVPALDLKQKIDFKNGNYASQLITLNKLIDIDKDVQMWYGYRAKAHEKLGKQKAAEEDLKIIDALNRTGKLPD